MVLHLKEEAKRYLENAEIERIVRTYSDHILFPIELKAGDGTLRPINEASALWQRAKSEVKPEEYTKSYQVLAGAFDEPALTLHYRAEGRLSYAVLLFAPSSRPFDLFGPERKGHIKLYVRRVYITDDADLLPPYLRFVRGVIDSEDPPPQYLSRDAAEQSAGHTDTQGRLRPCFWASLARLPAKILPPTPSCGKPLAACSRRELMKIQSAAISSWAWRGLLRRRTRVCVRCKTTLRR